MSEQDRGAYAPQTDAPLTFDPRQTGGGGGPAPMTLLFSAIVLMAMIVGLLLFYRHGARHVGQPPVLVGAPVGQTKSPPPTDTQSGDQAAGLQVYKDEAVPPSEAGPSPSFERAPEQPAPLQAPRPATPPPALLSVEPPHRQAPPPAVHRAPPAPPAAATVAAKPQPKTPFIKPPDTDNMVASNAFSPSHPALQSHPATAAPPKPAPAPAAAKLAATKPKPTAAAPTPPAPTTPPPTTASPGAGKVLAQIGAFSSAALAQQGWTDTAHLLPSEVAGKTRGVEETTKGGKTFYRAYVGGFASKAEAADFCAALKAKAKPCFVK